MNKHLVLLGAGHAHLHVLKSLAQESAAGLKVTLVSPFESLVYSGMVPGWVAGHYTIEQCSIAIEPPARAAGATFVRSAATGLDAASRKVALAGGEHIGYDVLSIDTGSVMDREQIAGAREHALFVRPMEHFVQLYPSLPPLAAARRLNVVVIGGGAGGVELAMALAHRLGAQARASVVTGGGPPLANASVRLQRRVQRALQRRGIAIFDDVAREISATHVRLAGGARLACDAPVVATGGAAAPWLLRSGLALDAKGYVATTKSLQSRSHPEVFAAGDVATRDDGPHPKSGVYAVRAGPALANNLRRFVAGGTPAAWRPPSRTLNLLSCGERYAIASWGAFSLEGGWVWRWKDHIDRAWVARHATTRGEVTERGIAPGGSRPHTDRSR